VSHPALHTERLGAGRRLVLVHGFTQTGRSWLPLARPLSLDHEVVMVDAPGHGGSSHIAADLVTSADLLVAAGGPAIYIGYSMGGRLALHAALAHPGSVTGLVLLGATPGLTTEAERQARRAADDALAAELERDGLDAFLDRWLALPLFARLPSSAAGRDDRRRNTVAGLAASLRHCGTGTQADLAPRLGELAMPVLTLAGEHDTAFVERSRRLAELVGPNATHAVVPGAGHAAHLERPDEFLSIVQAWLAASSAQPPSANPTVNARP